MKDRATATLIDVIENPVINYKLFSENIYSIDLHKKTLLCFQKKYKYLKYNLLKMFIKNDEVDADRLIK